MKFNWTTFLFFFSTLSSPILAKFKFWTRKFQTDPSLIYYCHVTSMQHFFEVA